ncbi:MAG: L-gulono,4-lactone dehydrogenase [Burkholderiales bacterium]|nr:L-gulono,4-lactone dehydrogenase [Burkholderiales bacterium]
MGALAPRPAFSQSAVQPKPKPKGKAEIEGVFVNDVHSALTATMVSQILLPGSVDDLRAAFKLARTEERSICVAGSRHSMGQQGFATDGILLDTRKMNRVLGFDTGRGLIEVEAGMQWPQLLNELTVGQRGDDQPWAFAQKQVGADRMTIGGSLSANIHGRGLVMPPFINDIEAFRLLTARGELLRCSRDENPELFALAIGGYGLFGVITSVTLRLVPRRKVQRLVEVRSATGIARAFAERIEDGFLYGEFELSVDEKSADFLDRGIFSTWRPVADDMPLPGLQRHLAEADWRELLFLSHTNKAEAFRRYTRYCLSTHERVYYSDEQQMSAYPEHYHRELDRRTGARGTDVLTETCCERSALEAFLADLRAYAPAAGLNIVRASVRMIEQDKESFLPWARRPYACVSLDLHVERGTRGLIHAGDAFRRLIDLGLRYGGSYYLAYHRHAIKRQLLAGYPQFPQFLQFKRKYDPRELFQSDWYRHYRGML